MVLIEIRKNYKAIEVLTKVVDRAKSQGDQKGAHMATILIEEFGGQDQDSNDDSLQVEDGLVEQFD